MKLMAFMMVVVTGGMRCQEGGSSAHCGPAFTTSTRQSPGPGPRLAAVTLVCITRLASTLLGDN